MNYPTKGKVKRSMEVYLKEALEDLPEEIIGRAEMPVATHLFEVRSGKEKY